MTDKNLQDVKDALLDIRTQMERIREEVKGEVEGIKGRLDILDDIQGNVTGFSKYFPKQAKEYQFHRNMNYCIAAMVVGVSVANLGYAQGQSDVIWAGTVLSFLGILVTFIVIRKGIRQQRGE